MGSEARRRNILMAHYPAALDEAQRRNARLTRNDIEWAVDGGGNLYLTDARSFTAWNQQECERRAEQDRRNWKAAQARPL